MAYVVRSDDELAPALADYLEANTPEEALDVVVMGCDMCGIGWTPRMIIADLRSDDLHQDTIETLIGLRLEAQRLRCDPIDLTRILGEED